MKKGFTLAEVLITLGIIGVLAALTMPNLIQNNQKKITVAQLQRTCNMISNAATQLMAIENAPSLAETYLVPSENDYDNAQGKFLRDYFKVSRDCGIENRKNCLPEKYFSLDRTQSDDTENIIPDKFYCVAINTGATVCMDYMRNDNIDKKGNVTKHGYSKVILDINGPAGPNANGRDLFEFELYSNGNMGNGYRPDEDRASGKKCKDNQSTADYGGSCFQAIAANGWVMDY